MFKEILSAAAQISGLTFTERQLEQFEIFYNLIVDWNTKINLTAIVNAKDFAVKHVIDSLTVWDEGKFINVKNFVDVGTGAGFPAIPLKIFKPNLEVTLIDSLAKRVEFLKKVVAELKLDGVECLHGRAEDLARDKNLRESFDLVTARAVARLNVLAEYCLPFVKVGGTFAALKGKIFREEIVESEKAIKILGGDNITYNEKNLPDLPDVRAVIYVDKKFSTPKKFPRKAGTPAKNPLS
ncbi:MAG: 16S rRNA (guanine(527)-N(7))-methyltransferase RsmG [Selenomonadaceae bacterium]|nr:16S rRNA (guanine(527)-N(7))-methyltransferase RsmG [Selenomonadaceae bacterium]